MRLRQEVQALSRRPATGERLTRTRERPSRVHVVACVLIDRRGRILIAQRPPGKALAGSWEFPGGKLEPGESRTEALARELFEELGLRIRAPRPLLRLTHSYPHAEVLLDVWVVRRYRGRLERREGQALAWVTRAQLARAELLPADAAIVDVLRLPQRLSMPASRHYRIVSAKALRPAIRMPPPHRVLVGVTARSVRQAMRLTGADFVVMREPLAERELAALCASSPRPVYATGLSLERAWALGASGVHSIRWS